MIGFSEYLRASSLILSLFFAGVAAAQQAYTPRWSSYVGGPNFSDKVSAAAIGQDASCFIGGTLEEGLIITNNSGDTFAPPSWGSDAFVAKVNGSGGFQWATLFGDAPDGETRGVALGADEAVIAVGRLSPSSSFAGTNAFAAALNPTDGSVTWSVLLGDALAGTNDCFNAVATDASGNIYAVGYTIQTNLGFNVPGYAVSNRTYGLQYKGNTDAIVVKLSPSGTTLWRHYLGGVNEDRATAVAVTSDGAVYVGGQTMSSNWVTLAAGTLPSPSNPDGFLVKLTASGAHVWSAFLGGSAGSDAVSALTADASIQAVYVGGRTGSGNFLSTANRLNSYAGGASDGFLVKITDTNTAFRTDWCRFIGSNSTDRVNALALRTDRQVAVGGLLTAGSDPNGFFAFADTDGALLWPTAVGGTNTDEVCAVGTAFETLFTAGTTFSGGWVSGGFCDEWLKYDWGTAESFGFVGKWMLGAGTAPAITNDLQDVSVIEGAPATFRVGASGTETLIYRWTRNGAPVAWPNTNVYTLASAALSNNTDTFACTVSNYWGAAASRTATLTVIAKGTLSVTLAPSEALAQGARWSFNGGATWLTSGTATNLTPGTYTVTFKPVTGWTAPATASNVVVASGVPSALSRSYAAILPEAARAVSGTNVTLTVRAPAGLSTWTLVETLQAGLTPAQITGGGVWNSGARTLTFTGAEATTNTLTYSVICTTSGVYSVTGTVTPQPANIPMAVTGPQQIMEAKLVRTISGQTVTITMLQPTINKSWYVNELLPSGLSATVLSGPAGSWIPEEGMIYWGTYGKGQTLSYEVEGAPGTYTVGGIVSIAGVVEPIFGDSVVTIAGEEIPAPNILSLTPVAGGASYILTFTSVVNQAYAVLTNGVPAASNGWATCLAPVTGTGATTPCEVPAAGPRLFYRVRAE